MVLIDYHTNMLSYRCRELKYQDLVDMKILSVLFKMHKNMPISINVQCLLSKHVALHLIIGLTAFVSQLLLFLSQYICIYIYIYIHIYIYIVVNHFCKDYVLLATVYMSHPIEY